MRETKGAAPADRRAAFGGTDSHVNALGPEAPRHLDVAAGPGGKGNDAPAHGARVARNRLRRGCFWGYRGASTPRNVDT
jgi:hypothetical protein